MSTETQWLTLAEVAEMYKLSQRTVRRMIAEGMLPAFRVGPRQIRIKRTDVCDLATPITPGEDLS